MVLNRERRIEFASPNAVSALHRLGVQAELIGRGLESIGIDDAVVRRALETRLSTITEIDHSDDLSVVLRCHPLLARDAPPGCSCSLETSVNCAVESGCWFPRTPRFARFTTG